MLRIKKPDDFHLHIREADMLKNVLGYSAQVFARAIIMPNTTKPILTAESLIYYKAEIMDCLASEGHKSFAPLMTIQITEQTTPSVIFKAHQAGAIAGKVYPKGMTTNSENGVENYPKLWVALNAMQMVGMKLLLHGEKPGSSSLNREKDFLEILESIATEFPRLKIVMEHLTTKQAVLRVSRLPGNVAGTITAHHLYLTLDDIIGGKLKPHHFCKPIAKSKEDRLALIEAATSGNPKFFFGSDSAPHLKGAKECEEGCAGVFTAPLAIPLLAEIFEKENRLARLENFVSVFGASFYGLPVNSGLLELSKSPWIVPKEFHGIVPFKAGQEINWQVKI